MTPSELQAIRERARTAPAPMNGTDAQRFWMDVVDLLAHADALDHARETELQRGNLWRDNANELERMCRRLTDERDALRATASRLTGRVEELEGALKRVTDDADRIGGDGYGMPECPWCHADVSSDEASPWHNPGCELVAARAALSPAEPKGGANDKCEGCGREDHTGLCDE